jgi:hypothetical protein
MESMESQRSRLSTLPTLLGNPFGITIFPQPRLLAYFKVQELERPNPRPLDLKGVVMKVLGPKCNERSTTLRWSVLGLHMGWLDRAVTPTARSTAAGLATPRKKKHD